MKNTRLAIISTALIISAGFALAQNEDAIRERVAVPPADALLGGGGGGGGQSFSEQEVRLTAAKDQVRQANKALESSQKAMQYAQAKAVETSGKIFTKRLAGVTQRSGSAGRALVIPKDATDAKSLADVEEDLNVMAHILDRAASSDDKSARAMGIPVFGRISGGGNAPQNLYIEGHGALFFENVNYPLTPPPAKENDATPKEKTNSEWEEARKEMTQPKPFGGADAFVAYGGNFDHFEREFSWDGNPPSPYDADKVEELKKDLIAALKNAANIRKLKSDETVTVVVTGASAGGSSKTIKSSGSKPKPEGKDEDVLIAEMTTIKTGAPASAPAKLILRVRKSDAEAFQNGKLTLDEFRKKVTAMIY